MHSCNNLYKTSAVCSYEIQQNSITKPRLSTQTNWMESQFNRVLPSLIISKLLKHKEKCYSWEISHCKNVSCQSIVWFWDLGLTLLLPASGYIFHLFKQWSTSLYLLNCFRLQSSNVIELLNKNIQSLDVEWVTSYIYLYCHSVQEYVITK